VATSSPQPSHLKVSEIKVSGRIVAAPKLVGEKVVEAPKVVEEVAAAEPAKGAAKGGAKGAETAKGIAAPKAAEPAKGAAASKAAEPAKGGKAGKRWQIPLISPLPRHFFYSVFFTLPGLSGLHYRAGIYILTAQMYINADTGRLKTPLQPLKRPHSQPTVTP